MEGFSRRHVLKKKVKEEEDRISGLPEEVIVEILSRLALKNAMSSSILSRRLRYLWTFVSRDLSFDPVKKLDDTAYGEYEFWRGISDYKANYVACVNHVLKLHQGAVVDRFRICFDFDQTYSDLVDTCVNFAMKKRVRELELNFSDFFGFPQRHPYCLKLNSNITFTTPTLNSLTSLRLISVDVSPEVVEFFLAKCPLLDELCVMESNYLTNLKVVGPKLKYLDMYRCGPMNKLEIISAPKLVYFSYSGPNTEVPFKDGAVPLLSELFIGDKFRKSFLCEAPKHSRYLSGLTKLTIVLRGWEQFFKPKYPLTLCNLKQLEVRFGITEWQQLLWSNFLVKASPVLSKFVLKIALGSPQPFCYEEYLLKPKKCRDYDPNLVNHECLKEIEFIGFVGNSTHFKLAVHLLEFSSALEKITIDTRHPGAEHGPRVFCDAFADREAVDREGAKRVAQHLRSHAPQAVNLVII